MWWVLGSALVLPSDWWASACDPDCGVSRVSVVAPVVDAACPAGPPLLGFVGDHGGTLHALLVVAVLLVPAALAVPAARESAART